MDKRTKRVVMVTGANGNLGSAVAEAFFEVGDQLVLVGRKADRVREALPELVAEDPVFVAPSTDLTEPEAVDVYLKNKILYGPGKAANAGGVAVSGLEMSQNSMRIHWSREEVDNRLHFIMESIHKQCVKYGTQDNFINYVKGANVAGFIKVADSMLDQGVV